MLSVSRGEREPALSKYRAWNGPWEQDAEPLL